MKTCVMFCPTKTWGGIEKNVLLRARFFSEKGYNIYIVLLKGKFKEKFEKISNVTIVSVPQRGGDINIRVVSNYVKILKKIKPDIVFSALKKDWFLVTLSSRIAKVPRIILYLGILRKIKNNIKYRYVFKRADVRVLVNSNSLKNHLLKTTNFFSDNNLFCIYNGFTTPEENGTKINLKEKFKLSEKTVIIGCAGRFSEQKGFDLFPDILNQLPEHIHIVHAGSGEKEKEIKQKHSESNYKNRIHYLGYLNDIHPFLRSIDIFLLCSRFEGMANILNESLSHGKTVISTRVSGSEELLDNGKYGILTEIDDTKAMASAIQKIINGEIVFDSKKSQEYSQSKFSLEKMINETEILFFK